MFMGFREILKDELNYQDIKVKELAFKAGLNRRTIDNYLRTNESQPTAENAVKIAQALGVTVEYLVTGKEPFAPKADSGAIEGFNLCKKYFSVIQKLDAMPESTKKLLCRLISEWEG